nr:bifunctional L-3-cyanoalanine synthase/cysteine synthase D2-like [Quercus suber]POE59599.1 bifunctional l-3-cyanoalanine synthase/cysteine synthase d2 [Quercus suber]
MEDKCAIKKDVTELIGNTPMVYLNEVTFLYLKCTSRRQSNMNLMVPGSRNPLWGEEFNFAAEELPVEVVIMIYDPYHSYSYGSKT